MNANRRRGGILGVITGLGWLLGSLAAPGGDWPQWMGADRNGRTSEGVSVAWPVDGPRVVWSRSVGSGFSGPVVLGGRLVLHHRRGEEDVVECLDAGRGGEPLWRHVQPATYRDDFGFDDGPRATPAIAGGRVHAFGAEGMLTCLDLATGRLVWKVDVARELGAGKGFFGFACSPLVAGGRVMLNAGGRNGAGVVALDAGTGTLKWKATSHEAGYAAPVLMAAGDEARVVFFTREGLVITGMETGAVEAEFPWRSRQGASVNAATPLVVGRRVFLTSSYGTGAVLLEWTGKGTGVRSIWSGDDALSSHYASVVHRDGQIYGFHGRQETGAVLRCVDWATGKVRWTADPFGSGSLLLAGEQLVILSERGELLVAPAVPDGFKVRARAQVLGSGTRAAPALAAGRLYARDTRKLVCLEVGDSGK